jgi:hypothetical protein
MVSVPWSARHGSCHCTRLSALGLLARPGGRRSPDEARTAISLASTASSSARRRLRVRRSNHGLDLLGGACAARALLRRASGPLDGRIVLSGQSWKQPQVTSGLRADGHEPCARPRTRERFLRRRRPSSRRDDQTSEAVDVGSGGRRLVRTVAQNAASVGADGARREARPRKRSGAAGRLAIHHAAMASTWLAASGENSTRYRFTFSACGGGRGRSSRGLSAPRGTALQIARALGGHLDVRIVEGKWNA